MHPILILVPAAVLALVGEYWVQKVLRQYNSNEEDSFDLTGGELARELLDRSGLQDVKSEQEKSAKKILLASSLTHLASSLAGALSIWRWMPSPTGTGTPQPVPELAPMPRATPRPSPASVTAR